MQYSTFTRYGLRAIIRLALTTHETKKPVSVREIAEKEGISVKYLENIFAILKKGNFIYAQKGKFGGYLLSRPADQISMLDLILNLEGQIAPVRCVEDRNYCTHDPENCTVLPLWLDLNNNMINTLKDHSLQDMVTENIAK